MVKFFFLLGSLVEKLELQLIELHPAMKFMLFLLIPCFMFEQII